MDRTKLHNLIDMVVIALCAAICGSEGWADVERFGKAKRAWFARFLELPNGIPSHDTFGRVFARLDTSEFYACLQRWLRSLNQALTDHGIRLDGKTLRHSFDTASGKAALHLVNAWSSDLQACLGQVAVDEDSNEITAVPKLLEMLELTGAVVTLDAMHCQKETAQAICDRGADYVLTVKGNQPTLHAEIQQIFEDAGEKDYDVPGLRRLTMTEEGHGRKERREYYVMPAPQSLRDTGDWADLRTIGMVYREREGRDANSHEVVFFISSLTPTVKRLAKHLRGHWGVENSLHWSLDVTFGEDQSRIRRGSAPEIAGFFRRLALSILKRDTTVRKSSLRGKRLQAGWSNDILESILTGIQAR
jgi:predicted transposase YbfD/YdcC